MSVDEGYPVGWGKGNVSSWDECLLMSSWGDPSEVQYMDMYMYMCTWACSRGPAVDARARYYSMGEAVGNAME